MIEDHMLRRRGKKDLVDKHLTQRNINDILLLNCDFTHLHI